MTSAQAGALLLVLAAVLAVAKAVGSLFARWGQPAVIGEILAGILFGPTLLPAAVERTLFPVDLHLVLTALGDLGVAVFMFLIGQEFGRHPPRRQVGLVLATTAGSIALPFGGGVLLALTAAPAPAGAPLSAFALFLGTAMSVTAFPVLARIVRDRSLTGARVANLALASAAIGDLLAWALLAVAVMLASGQAQWKLLLAAPLLAVVFLVARPMLARWATWRVAREHAGEPIVPALVGLLVCGAVTELIGLHFIFGAFVFGLVMPTGVGGLREPTARQLGRVTESMLLPVYFVVAGIQVDLTKVGISGLGLFGAVMLVAVGGKFAGVTVGARAKGLDWRRSAALATLMNTRGLTELIILTTGRQLGLLDTGLYSLLVLMALVTTAMAGPLVRVLYPAPMVEMDREFLAAMATEKSPVTTGPAAGGREQ